MEIADLAANRLWHEHPIMSARVVLTRSQRAGIAVAAAVVALCLLLRPVETIAALVGVGSAIFLVATAFKLAVAMRGARFHVVEQVTRREVAARDDAALPVYTVLVPVFREANIVAQLVTNLRGIDWPVDRLEVLVLVEEGDDLTRNAIESASPPANIRIVTVPAGAPQTKPRACNVGLALASGEYLVIFDAEDTPEPDQLKKAYVAFQRDGGRLVCVHAALNYFNATENALTRMFTLEYRYGFDYMLAGLDASDLPIPLGGTSDHFRTAALTELGGWHPYNVTEDADLGVRASVLGYWVGVIFDLVLWALLNPVYWLQHSIASYTALWQLITRPHHWEKTAHGLTSHVC